MATKKAEEYHQLTINDIKIELPVEKIIIKQVQKVQETLPMRSSRSYMVSGNTAGISVTIPIVAAADTQLSSQIIQLFEYIKQFPFVFLKSDYIRDYLESTLRSISSFSEKSLADIYKTNKNAIEAFKLKSASEQQQEDSSGNKAVSGDMDPVVSSRLKEDVYNYFVDSVFGGINDYLVFAVNNMNIATIPETSDGVRMTLTMEYTMYKPYVSELLFRQPALDKVAYDEIIKKWNNDDENGDKEGWHLNNLALEDYILYNYRLAKNVTGDLSRSDMFKYMYGGRTQVDYTTGKLIGLDKSKSTILSYAGNTGTVNDIVFNLKDYSLNTGTGVLLSSVELNNSITSFISLNYSFNIIPILLQGQPFPVHQYMGINSSTGRIGFISRGDKAQNELNQISNFYSLFQSINPRVKQSITTGAPLPVVPKIEVINPFLNAFDIRNIVFAGQMKETLQGVSDGEQIVIGFMDSTRNDPKGFFPSRLNFSNSEDVYLPFLTDKFKDTIKKVTQDDGKSAIVLDLKKSVIEKMFTSNNAGDVIASLGVVSSAANNKKDLSDKTFDTLENSDGKLFARSDINKTVETFENIQTSGMVIDRNNPDYAHYYELNTILNNNVIYPNADLMKMFNDLYPGVKSFIESLKDDQLVTGFLTEFVTDYDSTFKPKINTDAAFIEQKFGKAKAIKDKYTPFTGQLINEILSYSDNGRILAQEFLPTIATYKLIEIIIRRATGGVDFYTSVDKFPSLYGQGIGFAKNQSTEQNSSSSTLAVYNSLKDDRSKQRQYVQQLAAQAAQEANIPVDLFLAQIEAESGFNPYQVSETGALGVAQMQPAFARDAGLVVSPELVKLDILREKTQGEQKQKIKTALRSQGDREIQNARATGSSDQRLELDLALKGAANKMASYIETYKGNYSRALAAYNAGPGNSTKYNDPSFAKGQTYDYVQKITKNRSKFSGFDNNSVHTGNTGADSNGLNAYFYMQRIINQYVTEIALASIKLVISKMLSDGEINKEDKNYIDLIISTNSKIISGPSYGDFSLPIHPALGKYISDNISDGSAENSAPTSPEVGAKISSGCMNIAVNPDEFIYSDVERMTENLNIPDGVESNPITLMYANSRGLSKEMSNIVATGTASAMTEYMKNPAAKDLFLDGSEGPSQLIDSNSGGYVTLSERQYVPFDTISTGSGDLSTSFKNTGQPFSRSVNMSKIDPRGTGKVDFGDEKPEETNTTGNGIPGAYAQETDFSDEDYVHTSVKLSTIDNYVKDNPGFRKALPTFKIFFLEEDSGDTIYRAFDDFYDVNGIIELSIVEEENNPVQTVFLTVVNPAQKIITPMDSVSGEHPEMSTKEIESAYRTNPMSNTKAYEDSTSIDNRFKGYFPLKENNKIIIYLGYDQDVNKLTKKFVGYISEMSDGEIINIVAHSYGAEFVIDRASGERAYSTNENGVYAVDVIKSILSQPHVRHFGKWQILIDSALRNDAAQLVQREIDKDKGFLRKLIRGSGFQDPTDENFVRRSLVVWGFLRSSNYAENIYIPFSKYVEKNIADIELKNAHSWRILQELEFKYPGIVIYPVPYDDRMTLFAGNPNATYAYRDYNLAELLLISKKNKGKTSVFSLVQESLLLNHASIDEDVTISGLFGYEVSVMNKNDLDTRIKNKVVKLNQQAQSVTGDNTFITENEVKSLMLVPGSQRKMMGLINSLFDVIPGVDGVSNSLSTTGMPLFSDAYSLSYELEELMVDQFTYLENRLSININDINSGNPRIDATGRAIVDAFADKYFQMKMAVWNATGVHKNASSENHLSDSNSIVAGVLMNFLMTVVDESWMGQEEEIFLSPQTQDSVKSLFNIIVGTENKSTSSRLKSTLHSMGGRPIMTQGPDASALFPGTSLAFNDAASFLFFPRIIGNLDETDKIVFKNLNFLLWSNLLQENLSGDSRFNDFKLRLQILSNYIVNDYVVSDIADSRNNQALLLMIACVTDPTIDIAKLKTIMDNFKNASGRISDIGQLVAGVSSLAVGAIVYAGGSATVAGVSTAASLAGTSTAVVGAAAAVGTTMAVGSALVAGVGVYLLVSLIAESASDVVNSSNRSGSSNVPWWNLDDYLRTYITNWAIISILVNPSGQITSSSTKYNKFVTSRNKMFRQYHVVRSNKNLIYNSLKYTENNVFNAVNVTYNGSTLSFDRSSTIKLDSSLPEWKIRMYPYPSASPLKSDDEAKRYALSMLEGHIKEPMMGAL